MSLALAERDLLPPSLTNAEVLSELIEGGAKLHGGREAPEPLHGIVPPLDRAMVLLDAVVYVSIAPAQHLPAEDPAGSPAGTEDVYPS